MMLQSAASTFAGARVRVAARRSTVRKQLSRMQTDCSGDAATLHAPAGAQAGGFAASQACDTRSDASRRSWLMAATVRLIGSDAVPPLRRPLAPLSWSLLTRALCGSPVRSHAAGGMGSTARSTAGPNDIHSGASRSAVPLVCALAGARRGSVGRPDAACVDRRPRRPRVWVDTRRAGAHKRSDILCSGGLRCRCLAHRACAAAAAANPGPRGRPPSCSGPAFPRF